MKPLTIAELIAELQRFPQYARVAVNNAPSRLVVDVVSVKVRGEVYVELRSQEDR